MGGSCRENRWIQAEPYSTPAALGAQRGRFGAHMEVGLINDGPVTVLVEL